MPWCRLLPCEQALVVRLSTSASQPVYIGTCCNHACRRPTFLPSMRLKAACAAEVLAEPRSRALTGFLSALANLAGPKQALRIVEDEPRLRVC